RGTGRSPLFDVALNMQGADARGLTLPGITSERFDGGLQHSKMDLTVEVWPEGPDLELNFEYSTDLFDESTIARMTRDFQAVLEAIVDDRDVPVADLFAELSPAGVDELASGPVSETPATTVLDLLHTGGGVAVSLDDT